MQVVNGSGFEMATSQSIDKYGVVYVVSVLKATFDIPLEPDEPVELSQQQVPVHAADIFVGEPGLSATLVESDFAFRKKKCDVVVVGDACAPSNQSVAELKIGFEIGGKSKFARIVGPRKWQRNGSKIEVGPSSKFTTMPTHYGTSFGGTWQSEDEADYECFGLNPVGTGFAVANRSRLNGAAAPTIEAPNQPITTADREYQPWGFGPIGRNCQPRVGYAGTYDQHWQDEIFPLQPMDFDDRFYQCVPEDQQIDHPHGGERVVLHNFHPEQSEMWFALPRDLDIPMVVLTASGKQFSLSPVVDTIVIEPSQRRFTLSWRAHMQVQRSLREISILAAGDVCKKWWNSQVYGEGGCSCDGLDTDPERLASLSELI